MADGKIVTFYSYKGGTGRSMALANVAWILAQTGHRVMAIDWDLEAPGLHRYFLPFLDDSELQETRGLIDLFWSYTDLVLTPKESWPPGIESPSSYADAQRYAVPLAFPFADSLAVCIFWEPGGRTRRMRTGCVDSTGPRSTGGLGARTTSTSSARAAPAVRVYADRQPDRRCRHLGDLHRPDARYRRPVLHVQPPELERHRGGRAVDRRSGASGTASPPRGDAS